MSIGLGLIVLIGLAVLLFRLGQKRLKRQRLDYITQFQFPLGLRDKLARRRPGLSENQLNQVEEALKQYFRAHLNSGYQFVSMPSQLADDLWHEFILYTRNYQLFCKHAFGRFFHHTPAVVLTSGQRRSNTGLRRVWWHCCLEENINPRKADRLPLLFALDGEFNLADGFRYAPDCRALAQDGTSYSYCGGDFSSPGFDGDTDGLGDGSSASDSSDSGSDSSCGGGCGGGGGD